MSPGLYENTQKNKLRQEAFDRLTSGAKKVYAGSERSAVPSAGHELTLVTREAAQKLLHDYTFFRQRDLVQSNLQMLEHHLREKTFKDGHTISLCVLPDGLKQIVNGYHRLTAVVNTGIPARFLIQEIPVADTKEVGSYYDTFDVHAKRSIAARMRGRPEADDLPSRHNVYSTMRVIVSGFGDAYNKAETADTNVLVRALEHYKSAIHEFELCLLGGEKGLPTDTSSCRNLRRRSVAAVALVTLQSPQTIAQAREFWTGVAVNDVLPKGDARRTLVDWLVQHKARLHQGQEWIAAALAWNAFYRGQDLNSLRVGAVETFRILGTEWHNGKPAHRGF